MPPAATRDWDATFDLYATTDPEAPQAAAALGYDRFHRVRWAASSQPFEAAAGASPLPAERLILYEVYVPRGKWSGWPPHCHDGWEGSPYLEETYYFRFDPPNGWCMHRN